MIQAGQNSVITDDIPSSRALWTVAEGVTTQSEAVSLYAPWRRRDIASMEIEVGTEPSYLEFCFGICCQDNRGSTDGGVHQGTEMKRPFSRSTKSLTKSKSLEVLSQLRRWRLGASV